MTPRITITTPFGTILTLVWKDRKVTVKGSDRDETYWKYLDSRGLFGKFGHLVDPNDCYFVDLVSAVANYVSPDKYEINKQGKVQIDKEVAEEPDLPEGVVT